MAEAPADSRPDAILDALAPLVTRWTMGASTASGSIAAAAPPEWRDAIGSAADADLRLLALSGHFLGTMITAAPAAPLRAVPDLPILSLPVLAGPPRHLSRRVLAAVRDSASRRALLAFLAVRGWSVHPGDWLPGTADEAVPDVYAPWCDWRAACAAADPLPRQAAAALSAETWDDFWPAARGVELARMRREDPAPARELIAARFGGEAAEARLRLLALLETGLSPEDRPFLASLAGDRAPKVKALAAALLARLGGGSGSGGGSEPDAAELAGFFELQTRGLLRRTRIIAARPVKTPAQASRRAALFHGVDFAGLATALGLSPEALAAQWHWGADSAADIGFAAMAERSAGAGEIAAVAAALEAAPATNIAAMQAIASRLGQAERCRLARRLIDRDGSFGLALAIAGPDPGIAAPIASAAGAAVLAVLAEADRDARSIGLSGELLALGLLASRDDARAALAAITATGIAAGDPRLDMLRLNIMLDNSSENRPDREENP